MSDQWKVVLAGGGTGGHIIPALAVADRIRAAGGDVHFVGTRGRIEERLVPPAGYPIEFIKVRPLTGGGLLQKGLGVASAPLSVGKAASLLRRLRPDVVMGVGGYVAGPVVLAARLLGLPTAFLEQNATVGLANRLLKHSVRRAFISYEETAAELPAGRAMFTGNPVKQQILDAARHKGFRPVEKPDRLRMLVMGGSQGARSIDQRVPRAMAQANLAGRVVVTHQGQAENLDNVRRAYADAGVEAKVVPFIDDMAQAYLDADLVVARSGATTVAELTVMGLPAVFLPYPHHADRQQEKNAAAMKRTGAAIVLDEKVTGVAELCSAIVSFVDDEKKRHEAALASARLGRPDAAQQIADALREMSR